MNPIRNESRSYLRNLEPKDRTLFIKKQNYKFCGGKNDVESLIYFVFYYGQIIMDASNFFILIIVAIVSYWLGANSVEPGVSQGAGVLTDTATGIDFPTSKKFSVAKPALSLAGIGTRKKAILNIYSLGFFVSDALQKQINKSSNTACQTIQESAHPKAVQLTFAMGIGPEKIAEAISQLGNSNHCSERITCHRHHHFSHIS
jgi:hypothetical protein